MGNTVGVVGKEDVQDFPQFHLYGGREKFAQIQNEEGKIDLRTIEDPYLRYGGDYAGDVKDIANFKYVTFRTLPRFSTEHRSLLAKHLTEDMFERCKLLRTSKHYSFSNAIQVGVVTPASDIGITAGDEESYVIFQDIFCPIIRDWHSFDPAKQKQRHDMNPSKLKMTKQQQELWSESVISTRIQAVRNLAGYALLPGMLESERKEVETKLKSFFLDWMGDLSGQYYELRNMPDSEILSLQQRGLLFHKPSFSSLLMGAGAARSWPDNRGIFHNEAQTALCWVNEEDHCRIISMELGGNISSVFTRFCALSDALKASAEANGTKLMWNETLGFLGTCPSNLGTGLRASVMVVLPEFNKLIHNGEAGLLEEICAAYDLQVFESTEVNSVAADGVFDVSNKQRMGFTEVELVQKLVNGVSRILQMEKILAVGSISEDLRVLIQVDRQKRINI